MDQNGSMHNSNISKNTNNSNNSYKYSAFYILHWSWSARHFFNMKVGVMFLCFTWVSLNQLALIAEAQSTRLFKKMLVPGTYWPTTIYRWVAFNLFTYTLYYHSVLSLTHKPSLWWCPSSIMLCVYNKLLNQSLSAITSVCSFHHRARPSVCWLSTKKDAFYELHWMFELQSCRSHKRRNDR